MWVWLKYLADGQQDLWEQRVQGNQNAVITALRGRKSLRLELYCEAEAEALRPAAERLRMAAGDGGMAPWGCGLGDKRLRLTP